MALDLTLSAPFSFSLLASTGHLSMLWGRAARGFVLESGAGKNPSGKVIEVWRNAYCGGLNVTAFGLHLVIPGGGPTSSQTASIHV